MTVVDVVKDLIRDTVHDVLNSSAAILNINWVTDVPDNIVTDGGDQIIFREEE